MAVLLVGANPGLSLFADPDEDTTPIAFASIWRVDWSTHGSGRALLLWHQGRVRLLSAEPELARWLAADFVRHFPEVAGLPWPEPSIEPAEIDVRLDLGAGFHAEAGDISIDITEPLDHRVAAMPDFVLGERSCGFSTVYVPCRAGSITVAGIRLLGQPRVIEKGPSSTAFLAEAEVWTDDQS